MSNEEQGRAQRFLPSIRLGGLFDIRYSTVRFLPLRLNVLNQLNQIRDNQIGAKILTAGIIRSQTQ